MTFNPKLFGLKNFYLYEIIATTYSLIDDETTIKPNASCMGIRIIDENQLEISPFYGTSTYENLSKNKIITINFIDDVYLYALAALKETKSPIGLKDFPSEYYDFKYIKAYTTDVPYIKKAWGILIGKVLQEFQKTKRDDLGEILIPIFKLNIIFNEKFRESHKLFNRAENLALETIILTTRLKLAKENEDSSLFSKIYEKIIDNIENIQRFGKNKRALKTLELVNKYISFLES
ncbi:MAG: DUF447 family protein [Promethearchaeota archaeon]|nr:MAG: DUF447 family protein [Candidatus Lokiarchaeota archaeon]